MQDDDRKTPNAARLTRAHERTLSGRVFAPKSLRGSLNLRFSRPTWSLIVIGTSGDIATEEAMMVELWCEPGS